jgi:hypothetical protein
MRSVAKALGVAVLFSAVLASAQTPDERKALAVELVALFDYRAMFGDAIKACGSESSYKADALALFQADPRSFGGVSPQSEYWPEAEAIFARYRAKMCDYLSPHEFAMFMSDQYANQLSVDELKAAIAFMSSPAGRRYNQASVYASNQLQTFAQRKMQELQRKAYEDVSRDIEALGKRYRDKPK